MSVPEINQTAALQQELLLYLWIVLLCAPPVAAGLVFSPFITLHLNPTLTASQRFHFWRNTLPDSIFTSADLLYSVCLVWCIIIYLKKKYMQYMMVLDFFHMFLVFFP